MSTPIGVLLMTFGSAVTSADVPAYLASVRGGRAVPEEVVAEFRRRYDRIGRSPLIEITLRQAEGLQRELDRRHTRGAFRVAAGMLHSEPRVPGALEGFIEQGIRRIIAIVLAPQYSQLILAGYQRAIDAARERHPQLDLSVAGAWHLLPAWIDSLAERVQEALDELPGDTARRIPIIFTAHSLPRVVVDRDPAYIEQLKDTARAVAERCNLAAERWRFAYQSAGHTPEEWLTPDVKDLLPALRTEGVEAVLIVPLQFLADHLEILYDIDVAAHEEATANGIRMHRIALPNTSPTFIGALAEVVARELGAHTPARVEAS
jgi:protoporphyrin/coproporphyrin ferrochelatase